MKILITGANGFIGRKLCAALSKDNQIVGIGAEDAVMPDIEYHLIDITNYDEIEKLFIKNKFDVVFHFAAVTFHDDIVNRKANTLYISLKGTENVVTLFNKYCNNAKFLYTSTGKVYGGGKEQPITELTPVNPKIPLGKSKYMTERLIDYYSEDNITNKFVIFRMFNIYGEGQRDSFVVPHIIKHVKENKTIPLGNLKDYRDYVYIDDLIECFTKFVNNDLSKQEKPVDIYNIGSGKPNCVQDILDVTEKLTGKKINVLINENRKRNDETEVEYADSSKIKAVIGWEANTDIEKGIKKILEAEGIIK